MDCTEQLTDVWERASLRLSDHQAHCGRCYAWRVHPECVTAAVLAEAAQALCWAIPQVGQDIETGDMVTLTAAPAGAPVEGWTLDGWCQCLHTDDYRPACVDHDLYQLTHKDGGVLLHVGRHEFTAA